MVAISRALRLEKLPAALSSLSFLGCLVAWAGFLSMYVPSHLIMNPIITLGLSAVVGIAAPLVAVLTGQPRSRLIYAGLMVNLLSLAFVAVWLVLLFDVPVQD